MDTKIIKHFQKADPLLYSAYLQLSDKNLTTSHLPPDHFSALCREIIGQQLSTKVASVIFARFQNLFPNREITATRLLTLAPESIRAVGLSTAKTKFLIDLGSKAHSNQISLSSLEKLDNETVIKELTTVKGIGPWTAEMFLIFSLGRQDVFSHGDLGLKNAIKKIYNLQNPTRQDLEKIVVKWTPYKSYACRILWRSLG